MRLFLVVLAASALSACAHSAPPESALSNVQVSQDGKPVWPPTGEGCEPFVACCEALRATDPSVGLMCQLVTAAGGACAEMKGKILGNAQEAKLTPAAACQ